MKTARIALVGAIALALSLLLCGTLELARADSPPSPTTTELGHDQPTGPTCHELTPTVPVSRPSIPADPIPLPLAIESLPPTHLAVHSVAPMGVPPLRAVVTVGPIDPPEHSWTNAQIADMEKAAQALERYGVAVTRFYHPEANWDQIQAAAEGANFFFYKGHGISWSAGPTPTVGGLALTDIMVSPDAIRSELRLAPGAVVMLYGCFTAGSAGSDPSPISATEARRRVAQYADPFIDIGAGVYFANIWDESFVAYVDALFADKPMGEVFRSHWAFDKSTFEAYPYVEKPGYELWLDPWADQSFFARWNQAFVGDPAATMTELMKPPVLDVSPGNVTFLQEAGSGQGRQFIEVGSVGWWGHWFSWTATATSSGWLAVAPESGMLPSSLVTVTVSSDALATGTYDGQVTVAAPQAEDSPQSIPVRLVVVDYLYRAYLPIAHKIER